MSEVKDDVNLVIGEKTILVRIGKGIILFEIVWRKKHWWSITRPVIEAQYA